MSDLVGKTISHYKILGKLGEGGMGVVYKAEDTKLSRIVAIKFLSHHISVDEEEKVRFEIEAKAAASLNNNNIATIHAIEEVDDEMFIVMEYIDGKELKDIMGTTPLSKKEVINFSTQIASGLNVAHKKGIVHRDIKSNNIMLTNDGVIKIMDFGLAKIKGGANVTQLGSTIGTIAYMSPEQSRGEEIDQRTDIWAFGVLLYEMLTGAKPFKGEYDQAIVYSVMNEEPTIENVPDEFKNIISKALAKSLDDRYKNIDEMINDFKLLEVEITSPHNQLQSKNIITDKKQLIMFSGVIVLLLAAVIYFFTNNKTTVVKEETNKIKMIVVLPFENLGSPDDDYFADGISEEISSKLASIAQLGVISRKSAAKYGKSDKTTKEIGKELGVNYILSGTIRWAKSKNKNDRVRITPQLIRVSDDRNIWSNSYDKVLDDIFTVQNDIAKKVVAQLGVTILSRSITNNSKPTQNIEAYNYYLRGMSYINRGYFLKSDLLNAVNLYKKAISKDNNFALAYAKLSKTYSTLYWFYYDRSKENIDKALELADKSFSIDPNSAEVHNAYGYYYYWVKLEYRKAIIEFNKALKKQPNNTEAYAGLGFVYRRMGKLDLAIKNLYKAYSLDPINLNKILNLAESYGLIRDFEKEDYYLNRVIELEPDNSYALSLQVINFIKWKGNLSTAKLIAKMITDDKYIELNFNVKIYNDILSRDFDKALSKLKNTTTGYAMGQLQYVPASLMSALVYRYKNDNKNAKFYFNKSKTLIEKKLRDDPRDSRIHSSLGIIYAGLGQRQKAIEYGKKGIELLPLEKEAYRGYYREWSMAQIYILLGDKDKALNKIDFLLSIPGDLTVNILKLDPIYDSLRELPSYKEIIAKYSKGYGT